MLPDRDSYYLYFDSNFKIVPKIDSLYQTLLDIFYNFNRITPIIINYNPHWCMSPKQGTNQQDLGTLKEFQLEHSKAGGFHR